MLMRSGGNTLVCSFFIVALATTLLSSASDARRPRLTDWITIEDQRFGFHLAYPGNVFAPRAGTEQQGGTVLVSHDGSAKLLVGTFENDTESTLEQYRDHLLSASYTGAAIDYAPFKKHWFIISGTRDGTHFYERVSFTCGGRLINSWALLYPVEARPFYDRVVEAIAQTYTPGSECD